MKWSVLNLSRSVRPGDVDFDVDRAGAGSFPNGSQAIFRLFFAYFFKIQKPKPILAAFKNRLNSFWKLAGRHPLLWTWCFDTSGLVIFKCWTLQGYNCAPLNNLSSSSLNAKYSNQLNPRPDKVSKIGSNRICCFGYFWKLWSSGFFYFSMLRKISADNSGSRQ